MLGTYYHLAKPGIIYGNIMTLIAGFLFGSAWKGDLTVFSAAVAGTALLIASGAVCNNIIDRHIDSKMERTKDRALVQGIIPISHAIFYAFILGCVAFLLLVVGVNALTALIGFIGFIFYVVLYSIGKRASHWGAIIGSVAGAVSIAMGYTAATNRVDAAAVILFLCMVLWQMPHFYAIAMFRRTDYAAASIPVFPIVKGNDIAKRHMLLYIMAYIIATGMLTLAGYAGITFLVGMTLLGCGWFYRSIRGFKTDDDVAWARRLFKFSLIVLLSFSLLLAFSPLLP